MEMYFDEMFESVLNSCFMKGLERYCMDSNG